MVTGAYSVFASSVEWYRNYLYLLLLHLDDAKGLKPYYSGLRKTIRPPEFQSIKFPVPPESEARNICRYVELETARIDALIKKKTRFIELLKEKRQALITQAVTKGLDPTVPMKDSGIEDLEAVPSHWQVRLLSGLATKVTNGYVGPTRNILVEDGVRYLQSLHIKSNRIIFGKPYYVTESWSNEHKKSILNVGDVLIVQTGDVGQVAVVPEEFAGCNCHALIIVATTADLDGAYLSWLLNSQFGQASIKRIQTGAMHPHLNCDQVKTLKIPLPPLDEQLEIVNRIDTDIGRMEVLGERTNRSIDLLKERRSALITAAVTGQIDLREDAA
ncbi:MAG: restriction endonuclease subunit S [Chromatiales bacterium]|nr:restriction endonuclease subunit S [Chromatiales bacterium]